LAVLRVTLAQVLEDGLAAARGVILDRTALPADEARWHRNGPGGAIAPSPALIDRQLPEVRRAQLASVLMFNETDPAEDTMLPRLLHEARAAGVRVLVVRPPMRPDLPEVDGVPPEAVAEVAAV